MADRAPLSFGQLSVLRYIEPIPQRYWGEVNLRRLVRPPWADIDAGMAALRALAHRHESLRTTYELDGTGAQLVHDDPDLPIEVLHDEREPAELLPDFAGEPFTLSDDLGWRAVLTVSGDGPPALLLVVHHMVADGWAFRRLIAELTAPATVDEAAPTGPRALALAQHSTAWDRKRRDAASYWRAFLESGVRQVFPEPVADPETGAARVMSTMDLRGQSALVAELATRWGVFAQSVLLTATALGIYRSLRIEECVITLMCSNRFLPGSQGLVTTMNQHVPLLLRFDPDEPIDATVRAVHRSSVRAYRTGCYDTDSISELVAVPGLRPIELDYVFNYMAEDSALDAGAELGPVDEPQWAATARRTGARLSVIVSGAESLNIEVNSDPTVFPPRQVHDILRGVSRLIERATAEPDASTGSLLEH